MGSLTLVSTITPGRIRSAPRRNAEPGRTYWARFTSGVRFVRGDPVLPWLMLLIAGMNFGFAGPVTAGLPLLAAQHQWGAHGAGLLLGGFGFGAAATGLGLVFVRRIPRAGLMCTAGVTTMGISLCLLAWADTILQAMAAVIVLGLASGLFGTVVHAMVLTTTPRDELGRVMGLLSLSIEGVVPLSFAAAGALAGAVSVQATFAVGGVVILLTTAIACSRPRLRTFQLTPPNQPN